MSDYFIAPRTSFVATSDAIREKTGSQDGIVWGQDGFASTLNSLTTYANSVTGESDTNLSDAVASLADGYGGGGGDNIADLLANNLVSYTNNTVTDPLYVFRGTGIQSLTLYALTKLRADALNGCTNLESLIAPNLTEIAGSSAIRGTKITTLVLPRLSSANQRYGISNNTRLTKIDFTDLSSLGGDFFLEGNSALNVIVLRRTVGVVTLANVNRFNSTPFASSGSGGTLYVPNSLISSYQSASNWSAILGYANNNIQAIEGSIYENAYVDGTPISS